MRHVQDVGAYGLREASDRRKQAVEDGAVVASLLELGSVPELGDRWWLLGRTAGKSNSERWYSGRVVGITLGVHFTVELDDPSAPAHDGNDE